MSTMYEVLPPSSIRFDRLTDAELQPHGLRVSPHPAQDETRLCLTDGSDYLWAYAKDDGAAYFERWGGNNVKVLLDSLKECFGVVLVSEHDPRYPIDEALADKDE
jgi:hypothetical protein